GDGLVLGSTATTSSSGSLIEGLVINGFASGAAIRIQTSNDKVQGNYLGTNVTGTAVGPGNQVNILISSTNNTIGGTSDPPCHLIGLGTAAGVEITGATATGNVVLGNRIGTNATGANLGNDTGVSINNAANNVIGGNGPGAANLISFSTGAGVSISGA